MPTYEYVCQKCEHEFEVFQSMKDKPLTKCPDKTCGGKVKRKLGTGAGIIFKGSGFYTTDYRSDSYKKAASADTSTSSSGESTAKPETKSEPKAESKPKKEPKKPKAS